MKLSTNYKPKKSEAYNTIYNARKEGRQLEQIELDMLLNYFAPARPKNPKTPEEWVATACGKTDVRYYLNYLYVVDGIAYGTDGHRLHWCETEFEAGYYDPAMLLPTECDGRYPDVKRVIPNKLSGSDHVVGGEVAGVNPDSKTKVVHFVALEHGGNFDRKYWEQAVANDDSATYSVEGDNAYSKVRGRNKFGQFVISGMRV
jgi:hypothetical protein